MSSSKLLDIKYCIKKDGKVITITKEEYEEFEKQLEKSGKSYICPNCNVCDCEKIKYTCIDICDEVNVGTYVRKLFEFTNGEKTRRTKDVDFKVYDCKRFTPYKQLKSIDDKIKAEEVIKIHKELLDLKKESNNYSDQTTAEKILSLSYLKRDMLNSIRDNRIKAEVNKELEKIQKEYREEALKGLKLSLQK